MIDTDRIPDQRKVDIGQLRDVRQDVTLEDALPRPSADVGSPSRQVGNAGARCEVEAREVGGVGLGRREVRVVCDESLG